MRYVKYILITIFILVLSLPLFGQDTSDYETYFYPEVESNPMYMVQTSSGIAYITRGDAQGLYMVKFDNDFELEWHKQVFFLDGQTSPDGLYWDKDEKYYICAGTGWRYNDNYGYTVASAFVVKIDTLGNVIDKKLPPQYYNSWIEDFVVHKDKILALYCETKEKGDPNKEYILCYKKKNLELVWKKEFNALSSLAMTKQKDGVVIYTYYDSEKDKFTSNHSIKKFDFKGNLKWEKDAGKKAGSGLQRLITISNNQMLYTGTGKESSNRHKAVLKKFDKNGNLIFDKAYDSFTQSRPRFAVELKNGDYVLSINDESEPFSTKTSIARTDSLGNIKMTSEYFNDMSIMNGIYHQEEETIICSGAHVSGPFIMIVPTDSLTTPIVKQNSKLPNKFKLYQNYPNPFNSLTTIQYSIPKDMFVNLTIYDITGKKVKTLVNKHKYQGRYKKTWNANNVSSGVYFYKLETKNKNTSTVKKMVLVK